MVEVYFFLSAFTCNVQIFIYSSLCIKTNLIGSFYSLAFLEFWSLYMCNGCTITSARPYIDLAWNVSVGRSSPSLSVTVIEFRLYWLNFTNLFFKSFLNDILKCLCWFSIASIQFFGFSYLIETACVDYLSKHEVRKLTWQLERLIGTP